MSVVGSLGTPGGRALAVRRHELIVARLRAQGSVRVAELAVALDVSEMTVRRDLDALAEQGVLDKVHGGATLRDERSVHEPGFAVKSLLHQDEKVAIGDAAASRVLPGTAIGITGGTTTFRLATAIGDVANLTVVTNCVHVAEHLHRFPRTDRTVVLIGGVRTPSDALVGPLAVQALSQLHLDSVFLGVHGMSVRGGFTTPNLAEAETNRAFVAATQRLIVLADHSKWNLTGMCTIAPLSAAAVLITDSAIRAEARAALHEACGEVIVAPVADGGSTAASTMPSREV